MKHLLIVISVMLFALPLAASEDKPVVVTPVATTAVTASGQPITLPQGNVQVAVSTYDIAANARLPEHKHPFPRYGYVLSGTLRVTNTETGKSDVYKAGDFIVEAVGQWHQAANEGAEQVKLLVIDMIEKGESNVVVR
jgi:quercetin dioxygenase-like cupin family protein